MNLEIWVSRKTRLVRTLRSSPVIPRKLTPSHAQSFVPLTNSFQRIQPCLLVSIPWKWKGAQLTAFSCLQRRSYVSYCSECSVPYFSSFFTVLGDYPRALT